MLLGCVRHGGSRERFVEPEQKVGGVVMSKKVFLVVTAWTTTN
jgi:hypothetical protein